MGLCASSQAKAGSKPPNIARSGPDIPRSGAPSPTVKVINLQGKLQEYSPPIRARHVTGPGCFLCCSDSMSIGTCAPRVPDEEELHPAHIYFLLPASDAHNPLTLPALCSLAVQASSALHSLPPCSSSSALIFP